MMNVHAKVSPLSKTLIWFVLLLLFVKDTLEEQNHYTVPVPGGDDLVLHARDSQCDAIKHYCSPKGRTSTSTFCTAQLSSVVLKQLIGEYTEVLKEFVLDERLFNECEEIVTCADTTCDTSFARFVRGRAWCTKTSQHIIADTLSLLDRAAQSDDAAMNVFKERRDKVLVHLSDVEKLELYRRAILLLPNNSCIVDQFGLSLMYLGREDLARKIFTQAVDRQLWSHPLHRPLFQNIPGLKQLEREDLHFVSVLESGYSEMKAELLHNLKTNSHLFALEEWNTNIPVGGNWTELRLKSSQGFTEYSKYFPKTIAYIKACNEVFVSIKYSALQPGTHIRPHTGPSNALLRTHLTLVHTGGARMRIGSKWTYFEEGKAIVFDSSWEHEVHHDGNDIRVVLILDVWHPDVPKSQQIKL